MPAVGEGVNVGGEDVVGRCAGRVVTFTRPRRRFMTTLRARGSRADLQGDPVRARRPFYLTSRTRRGAARAAISRARRPGANLIIRECGLVGLVQHAVFEDQGVHLGAHEAAVRILGVQTIGSPRTLNDVLTMTGQPVARRNASRMSQ